MISKRFEDVSLEDIEYLSKNKVEEDSYTEYKSMINLEQDKDKKEFLKDILSMANADGGYIILGIDEKDNYNLKGMTIKNWDNFELQMISIIKDSSDPIFTKLRFKHFQIGRDKDKYIVCICIGKSEIKPHRSKKDNCFYKRIGTQCVNLDVANLKQEILYAYLMGDESKKKDNEFVQNVLDERIKKSNPILTISFFPASELYQNITMDYTNFFQQYNEMMKQNLLSVDTCRIVQNGIKLLDEWKGIECLTCKNGEVYFCYDWTLDTDDKIDAQICFYYDRIIIGILDFLKAIFNYTGGYRIFINLLKAKGKTLNTNMGHLRASPFTKDRIICSTSIESSSDLRHRIDLLDELCNAAGVDRYLTLRNMFP